MLPISSCHVTAENTGVGKSEQKDGIRPVGEGGVIDKAVHGRRAKKHTSLQLIHARTHRTTSKKKKSHRHIGAIPIVDGILPIVRRAAAGRLLLLRRLRRRRYRGSLRLLRLLRRLPFRLLLLLFGLYLGR